MMVIYLALFYSQIYLVDAASVITQLTYLAYTAVQLVIPSVLGELIESEVESISCFLHAKLVSKIDESTENQIICFVRYIEARPVRQRVGRHLHVNLSLPVSVLSFCVTYMIVVIQLTHIDL
nr:uncharacterized protein LOC128678385 [Plodia interpunctella]